MPLDLLTRLDPLRRIRCPSCFAEFAAFQMHVRCASDLCRTDLGRQVEDPILTRTLTGREPVPGSRKALRSPWWVDPRHDPRRKVRGWLDWLLLPGSLTCPYCEQASDLRLCPRCHRELPERALRRPGGSVTIFGPRGVGKTTYVTVLLQEIKKAADTPRRLGLRALDEEVRRRYREEYFDVTYGSPGADGPGRRRHAATQSLDVDRRVLQPFVFELKTAAAGPGPIVSFCDLAGEDWEFKVELLRREGGHLVRGAGGLLFVIDPLRIPQVAAQVVRTEEEEAFSPADYVEDADKLAEFFPKLPARTPLAIVLNKIDRWGPLLGEETLLHQIARSAPTETPDKKLDRAIHEEVRSALRHWGQVEFLDRLESDFPTHQFFACSALGDAAQVDDEAPMPLPTPLLVERAAVWLLDRQGLLR